MSYDEKIKTFAVLLVMLGIIAVVVVSVLAAN